MRCHEYPHFITQDLKSRKVRCMPKAIYRFKSGRAQAGIQTVSSIFLLPPPPTLIHQLPGSLSLNHLANLQEFLCQWQHLILNQNYDQKNFTLKSLLGYKSLKFYLTKCNINCCKGYKTEDMAVALKKPKVEMRRYKEHDFDSKKVNEQCHAEQVKNSKF